MKKSLILGLLLIVMPALAAACANQQQPDASNGAQAAPATPIRWELATHNTANTAYWEELVTFADAVRERSNGQLDISVRGGGELPFKGNEFLRVVSDGTIQMAEVPLGYVSGDISASVVPSWPMMAGTAEQLETVLPALSEITNQEVLDKGFQLEIMCSYGVPLQVFWGVGEPVSSLEQLRNMKVRVYSAEASEILGAIGVTPISMSVNEVVPSIQRKVIDAAVTGVSYADEAKWYDVCDWGYMLPLLGSVSHLIVGTEAMAALPEDLQTIVAEEAENLRRRNVDLAANTIDTSLANLEANGMVINYPTEEDLAYIQEVAEEYWQKWADNSDDATKEALDIAKGALGY